EKAQGCVFEMDQEALSRLTHLAQVLGAPWRRIEWQDAPLIVFARDAPSATGSASADALAALIGEAAEEILGYQGRLSMPEIAVRRTMILSRAWSRVMARTPAPSLERSATSTAEIDVLDVATPHEGYFLTRSYQLRHPVFAGGMSDVLSREVFVVADAALVLPYDPRSDRVLLVEQFRMGPFGRGDPRPWVLEPIAGRVDPGERPDACALRECVEEAHVSLDGLEHISSHYCSPGCSTELYHCFLGLCDLSDMKGGLGGLATEHEDIASHVLSFERVEALMRSGEINIGPLLLMLLWLQRERPRLKAIA
ncbi:MAG: NUDIX domain-containing protein, partial [Pseudomonadota bacterium]